MKYLALLFLITVTATAAELRITIPDLTERERYGLQLAVTVHNKANTNDVVNLSQYHQRALDTFAASLISHRASTLESYAQQRDAEERSRNEKRALFVAIDSAIASADTNKLARIKAILEEP